MTPKSFVFIGRAGAGKGTQAKLLETKLKSLHDRKVLHVETGAEFREFLKTDGYTAGLAKNVIESGGLMPEFMPVYMWGRLLTEEFTGQEHLIFDGTPRKLLEAQLLSSIFPFYSLENPLVIYLDIEHEESSKRLTLRAKEGRHDDNTEAIERRRIAFEQDVKPVVEWYRTNPQIRFLDIDGHGTIEDVHDRIVKEASLG